MVYLKGIFVMQSVLTVILLELLLHQTTASHTRIAYKKPISGSKSNKMRDKRMRITKHEQFELITANPVTHKPLTIMDTRLSKHDTEEHTTMTVTTRNEIVVKELMNNKKSIPISKDFPSTTESTNYPVPCTCGIFLSSQIKRGTSAAPDGEAVIRNELDRHYTCNAIGQKQCQTKCLETIVQHLPNSANILCATLNHDCRKERAHLFIKNCRHQWINTNLTAGREYCCKNGLPYQCPMV